MNEEFSYRITEEQLFCRRCRQLSLHGIYAEEAYSTHGGLLPKIPLLCVCDTCKTQYLAFSQEFSFVQSENIDQDYAKIPGKNRLFPGNWVYLPGAPRPGIIKRVTSAGNKKVLQVEIDHELHSIEIESPDPTQKEESPRGYRLLPAQSGETLIGDNIYHIIRGMFGKAIGMVQDGDIDKLVVQLENGTILFLTLPEACQCLPNIRLQETVKYKMQALPERLRNAIALEVHHGILYASGSVRSLSERRKIQEIFNSVPSLRGTINRIAVTPAQYVSDEELNDTIHKIFENSKSRDFAYYKISVKNSKVSITIGYYKESAVRIFETELENLQGIQELSILPECLPEPTLEETNRVRDAEMQIRNQSETSNVKIRVAFADGKIILSGRVSTLFQKKIIQFQVAKFPWKFSTVENNLRIVP